MDSPQAEKSAGFIHLLARGYQTFGGRLLLLVALSFPFVVYHAKTMPVNNNIETWLPGQSKVKAVYDSYKQEFGGEEVILVALKDLPVDSPLVESLRRRLEKLPEIRQCYSPATLRETMQNLKVSDEEIEDRLHGFLISKDDRLVGIVATLTAVGLKDRVETIRQIHLQLEYCQIQQNDYYMAGSPVLVAELDELGGSGKNNKYFFSMLLISLALLYFTVRHWKVSLTIFGLTLWSMHATMAAIKFAGGEKNFILSALSAMVLVFTLATSIHFLHYYRAALGKRNPLEEAFRAAWKPCCLATFTTVIGLISLSISDFAPVVQFGWGASIGACCALLTGLGFTPAVLAVWPDLFGKPSLATAHNPEEEHQQLGRVAGALLKRGKLITVAAVVLVLCTGFGIQRLTSKIDPADFLPSDNKVITDLKAIERDLTTVYSVEAIVEFDDEEMPFAEKLDKVRALEAVILEHPGIVQTKSVATFFPSQLPDNPYEVAAILSRAAAQQGNNSYLSDGDRLWRISAGFRSGSGHSESQILKDLEVATAGEPIHFTGISPLIENAQRSIFNGFWESFSMAFVIISIVMMISLRSFKLGLIAMVPNLAPICIVYGLLGWLKIPVDIGMMMTGSIALGIAVDGTFHFLVQYNQKYQQDGDSSLAARAALLQTGAPIFEAALVAGVGMLALSLSKFAPTARFGWMMTALLSAALVGDLVLLPAVLSFRSRKKVFDDEVDETDEIDEQPEVADEQTAGSAVPVPHHLQSRQPLDL